MSDLALSVCCGALGGFMRHLYFQHGLELPRRRGRRLELGVVQDILMGIGAAIVVVAGDHIPPIVLAVVGGWAGASVLNVKAADLLRPLVYTKGSQIVERIMDVEEEDGADGHDGRAPTVLSVEPGGAPPTAGGETVAD